jgi:hypothetical protein
MWRGDYSEGWLVTKFFRNNTVSPSGIGREQADYLTVLINGAMP